MVLGVLLTPCNVYSGLKTGWGFNMSIAAGLLGLGFWRVAAPRLGGRPWGLLENNINQTTTSASTAIISAGLVAPIPAYTIITGNQIDWHMMAIWVFAISMLGVVVAAGIRTQMIEREGLRFPAGVATAEMLTQIHAKGAESLGRLYLMLGALFVSAGWKLTQEFYVMTARLSPALGIPSFGALRASGVNSIGFHNLGLAFDPSFLMIGLGAIVGLRAAMSMLFGAAVAWIALGPWVLAQGWVAPGSPDAVWYQPLLGWLLWPGVTLLITSALVSLSISLSRLYVKGRRERAADRAASDAAPGRAGPGPAYIAAVIAVACLISLAAHVVFGLEVWVSLLAVAFSYVLAAVASRVAGETGITPVGALGKITQLTYGAITPGNVVSNLMTANITGGAAGQCADLLNDLRAGHIVGATPHLQIIAQMFGIFVGSFIGVLVYLLLIPDPASQLLTPEWPAPALAAWKAVAEVLSQGFHTIPEGAVEGMYAAGVIGCLMGTAERFAPETVRPWLPSAPAMSLGFVLPFWNPLSLFLGAFAAYLSERHVKGWTNQKTVAAAAGMVAGESLAGVGVSVAGLLKH